MALFNIFIITVVTAGIASAATDKIVCYHGTWSVWREGSGKYTVDDIDPTLCTHLIYAFVGINSDGRVKLLNEDIDIGRQNFQRFNALKQKNPNLRTLLAIGGWNEGSVSYSQVAANPSLRGNLINSALNLVLTHGFDGFDLDWEYPGQRGGAAADKQNYATLLKEFRQEFDKYGLLLTAAVSAISGLDLSYDVPALSKYLDIINIMAYDFHGSWEGRTGQNAPLYPSSVDVTADQKLFTVVGAVNAWISRGADPQKLALGLGTYGKSFTLSNSNNNGIGAPTIGAGNGGPYTREAGLLSYYEICSLQLGGGLTVVWDDNQKVPYAYTGNQWVGYDNPRSIAIKVEYAKSLNLGGVMIWTLETDDFRGICGEKYPLLNTVKTALKGTSDENLNPGDDDVSKKPSSTTTSTTTTTTTTTTTQAPIGNPSNPSELCTSAGYIRDPVDCSVFYYCLPNNGGFEALRQKCISGLVFDTQASVCNYPSLVQC